MGFREKAERTQLFVWLLSSKFNVRRN